MSSILLRALNELTSCLPDSKTTKRSEPERACLLANNIIIYCNSYFQNSTELVTASSLLFDHEYGILLFLRKCANLDEFYKSKTILLEYLPSFIDKIGKTGLKYCVDIKNVCVFLFNTVKRASIRVATVDVLIKVLHLCSGTDFGKKIEPSLLMEKFYLQLTQMSNLSPTVLQSIYHLLGVIVETSPEYVYHYSDRLLSVYFKELNKQMTSRSRAVDRVIIVGCFSGLVALLHTFPRPLKDEEAKQLFSYLRMAVQHDGHLARYDVPKGGLELIHKHASCFAKHLYKDYEYLYNNLWDWSQHSNREVSSLAYLAMEAFFQQVAILMCDEISNIEQCKTSTEEKYKFFLTRLSSVFQSNESSRWIAIAVKGYGLFAAPCKLLMDTNAVLIMFSDVLQHCEKVFFSNSEMLENRIQFLPSFIESLASIGCQLDEILETSLQSLENLAVSLIEHFPKVLHVHRFLCYHALIKLFVVLYPKGLFFKTFLAKIVYQGLLRTCSHTLVAEVDYEADNPEQSIENKADQPKGSNITYVDYLPLWSNLLDAVKLEALNSLGISLAQRQAVIDMLYDEILHSIIDIIKKLDLSTLKPIFSELEADHNLSSDPVASLHASNLNDFKIFINLVEFSRSLLRKKRVPLFEKWTYKFGYEVIALSSKFPLVSGLYKLLALCLEICSSSCFFKNVSVDGKALSESRDCSPATNFSEKLACFSLFSKAVKEITVRSLQYKDELLTSCLKVVLALPSEIFASNLMFFIPAVTKAFQIGPSYLKIAHDGLQALERWTTELSLDTLLPLFHQVLPLLNIFLKTSISTEVVDMVTLNGKSTRSKQRKIPVKIFKSPLKHELPSSLPEVMRVKQRIVRLLGNLGSGFNQFLIDDKIGTIAKSAVAWDTNKHLTFAIPFVDMKPLIELDGFLPRVIELSCWSSDRRTKAAASELLHALILFMLGSITTQTPGVQKKTPLTGLYKKIIPALLQLSCDTDLLMRDLFEPLTMQMIHWFSSKKTVDENTSVLLDSLMESVMNSSNSGLRDFSARCIKEYLIWSIKQSTPKSLEKNPYNTKALLRRIYSSSLHPDSFIRLGAARIFNVIVTVFREEEVLINIFILELLYYFVLSLAIAQNDNDQIGTRVQCQKALDHIERIVLDKSELLIKKDQKRRKPVEFADNDLQSATLWLLEQCGRPEADCRHHCIHLVYSFVPELRCGSSASEYFRLLLQDKGAEFFISKFEGLHRTIGERQYLQGSPTLEAHLLNGFSLRAIIYWFDVLLAALDCYISTFQTKVLKPDDIFAENSRSVLLMSVKYFIDNLTMADIWNLAKIFGHPSTSPLFTPFEVAEFNHKKCTVVVRILNFAETVIQCSCPNDLVFYKFLDEIIQESFWKLFLNCILCPLSVGFDVSNLEMMENLPKETERFLLILKQSFPKPQLQDFFTALSQRLTETHSCSIFAMLLTDTSLMDFAGCLSLSLLMSGYELIHRAELLLPALKIMGKNAVDLATDIFDFAWKMCVRDQGGIQYAVRLEGAWQSLAHRVIGFSFCLQYPLEQLIFLLMDDGLLTDPSGHSRLQKGAHFLLTFNSQVIDYLILKAPESIVLLVVWTVKRPFMLVNVLSALCDHIATNKKLLNHGIVVSETIFSNWSKFRHWWAGDTDESLKQLAVYLLTKSLTINSTPSDVLYTDVFEMFTVLLTDVKAKLRLKSQLLDTLPFFLRLSHEKMDMLRFHLTKMSSQIFPLKSTELQFGSHRCSEYISVLKKIFCALIMSGSLMLLEFISELICIEPKHVCEDLIQNTLKSFVKRLPDERFCAAVGIPMDMFWNETNAVVVRKSAFERIAVTILRGANKLTVLDFFTANIKRIMFILKDKPLKTTDEKFQQQLYSKIGCFKLMHILYEVGNKVELNSLQSKVNRSFCDDEPKSGRELTQEVTRLAHAAKKENDRGEAQFSEMRRQYRCAAYNALIAVISCTQIEAKFYNTFLFSENIAKGEFLWDNLVDTSRSYEFAIELNSPLEIRKLLLDIHQTSREPQKIAAVHDTGDLGNSFNVSLHHLTSVSLAGTSLSEDVAQFDFTSSSRDTKPSLMPSYLEIEVDDLNDHECMASLNAVLVHMTNIFNSSIPITKANDPVIKDEMPVWMKNLHAKLSSNDTHKNVKLFIAKLIINNEIVFRSYAKHWLYSLMQLIVSGIAGDNLNYFVRDVVTMLLSWSAVAIPQVSAVDREMATRLLGFLMQHASHARRDILRNNLEIIKTLMECWNGRLEISTKIIYNHLCHTDVDKLDNVVGIQLLGIVLSNGLSPYTPVIGLDENIFLETLAKNLTFKSKDVYGAAAEVIGMCLKHLAEKCSSNDFHNIVQKYLTKISNTQTDRFIYCLHHIQMSYPPINGSFVNKVVILLPRIHGIFLSLGLEIVLSWVNARDDIFLELRSIGFLSFLKHGDDLVQTLCLQIIYKILSRITVEHLLELLPLITECSKHLFLDCRKAAVEILILIYETYRNQEDKSDVILLAKDALLCVLSDGDLPLRLKVLNFWSNSSQLSQTTLVRTLNILDHLYSPACEHNFLGYATYLLLELSSKSPDYNQPMFKYPLQPDCKFENYDVSSSWQQQHSTMLPLFIETIVSTQLSEPVSFQPVPLPQLRATQENLEFAPTESMSKTYNWLTQSSFDTFFTVGVSGEDNIPSNLLFNTKKFVRQTDVTSEMGFGTNNAKLDPLADSDKLVPMNVHHLRRRFFKSNEVEQRRYARRTEQMKHQRELRRREQKLARESQVTIYRQYRKGDFPDIQINHSAIIAPLQALAQEDDHVAKMLFINLITGILKESRDLDDEKRVEVMTAIAKSLNIILEKSSSYNAGVISAIQELAYNFSELKVDVENLVTGSRASHQQNTGVLLLEKMLIDCSDVTEPRPAKQPRYESKSLPNKFLWVKLAELNKSLGCQDIVNSIFKHHVTTEIAIREAIAAEIVGNYSLAKKLYQKVFSQGGQSEISCDLLESDLWNECMLECLEKLKEWNRSSSFALQCFDDGDRPSFDSVWEDCYHQEHYLPFIIRGKLKLIMNGENEQEFVVFLDKALTNTEQPQRRRLLESRFSQELALLSIVQKDYDRARSYQHISLQQFLHDWLTLSDLAVFHLKAHLADLQTLIEMGEFLNVIEECGECFGELAMDLLQKWEKNCPDVHFDVGMLDDLAVNRRLFMKQLSDRALQNESLKLHFEKICLKNQLLLAIRCAESASQQNNSTIALTYLKDSASIYKKLDDDYLTCKWLHTYCRTHLDNKTSHPKLDVLLKVWKNLDENLKSAAVKSNVDLQLENLLLQSHNFYCINKCLEEDSTLSQIAMNDEFRDLFQYIDYTPTSNLEQFRTGLMEHSYRQLEAAAGLKDAKRIATAHLQLAKFCDHHLRKSEVTSFPEVITKNLFTSIKLGNPEAIHLFPRLLQLAEKYASVIAIFIEEVHDIPCWMFLSWIGQLVAVLDKPQGAAIHRLVAEIAKEYPNAIIYPFLVSRKGFSFADSSDGKRSKAVVDRIWDSLSRLWLVQQFIAALEQLPASFLAYQDALEELVTLKKNDGRAFQKLFEETYENLFVKPLMDMPDDNPVPYGKQSKNFAKSMVKLVDEAFGKKGCNLHLINAEEFEKKNSEILKSMKNVPNAGLLKDYSEWLSEFHVTKFNMELEIPGQYRGYVKPMPEYHTKIARFDEKILTLKSIRIPKRITMFGDDHKEYKFLVKGGEDLRQDQRIQRLFQMMNDIYGNDSACRSRKLSIVTYQVIPLNDRLGILEWIENAVPLKDLLECSTDIPKAKFNEPNRKHDEWIKNAATSKRYSSQVQLYHCAYQRYNRDETVEHYHQLTRAYPEYVLKKAFLKMSASLEAYIILRNHFITSHAVTSVSQYILGIGDRHLSNFMISRETGAIIAIDFGHAFGSATTLLPIPELMPMRLTPQILQMMEPMREHGLLETGLVHSLKALRYNKELLLNTMDIFINEPSLDWIKNARRQLRKMQNTSDDLEKNLSWYPEEKVKLVEEKLNGGNPGHIMAVELQLGHKKNKTFPILKKLCLGDSHNIRSLLPTKGLDVEKQVACLIDHATDPHILGKTWIGWNPWA